MKTIIAEKPSVAREIARIVGATKREEGYFEGGGYAVTWAFGHLVQLAMPDGYGVRGFVRDNLPIIPDTFTLVPRQVRTEKGYKPDSGVVSQIKVIKRLFDTSEHIIVATDAGREGELIFRYLYHYTGCTTPFVRLWISSLTDKAIREGLRKLEDGSKYDNLYLAAKARSESDWLVGINGTQALSIAAGHGTYSVGRVQTPTLAMVCERYWENRRFTSEAFWQLHIATDGCDGEVVKFSSSEKWKEKEPAMELYNKVKAAGCATVTKAERKEKTEETPLLYDLTTLQKEANAKHGFTAEQTLEIAQKLYEKKLITYPRTGSRYIPEDVFAEIPKLLAFIGTQPEWKDKVRAKAAPTRRSVDDGKVTDHHALLVTGEKPLFLSKEDNTIYQMIAGRMVEAFSEKCVKDVTTVTAECAGVEFTVKGSVVKQTGWRAVYGEEKEEITIPGWQEGDTLTPKGSSITEGKTKPKPLHTEATLLSAMETAGKEIEDDALRQAMKDCGIGTPATRAAIIETLFALLSAPHPDAVSYKPFHDKGRFICDTPDAVKHENQKNIELSISGVILDDLQLVTGRCADFVTGHALFLFFVDDDPALRFGKLVAGFALHRQVSFVVGIEIHLFIRGHAVQTAYAIIGHSVSLTFKVRMDDDSVVKERPVVVPWSSRTPLPPSV